MEQTPIKYLLKRLEISIKKFITVLSIDLDRLQKHSGNIRRLTNAAEWRELEKEEMNATHTVQQIKANINEIEKVRAKLLDGDHAKFDLRVSEVKEKAIKYVEQFLRQLGVHGQGQEDVEQQEVTSTFKPKADRGSDRVECGTGDVNFCVSQSERQKDEEGGEGSSHQNSISTATTSNLNSSLVVSNSLLQNQQQSFSTSSSCPHPPLLSHPIIPPLLKLNPNDNNTLSFAHDQVSNHDDDNNKDNDNVIDNDDDDVNCFSHNNHKQHNNRSSSLLQQQRKQQQQQQSIDQLLELELQLEDNNRLPKTTRPHLQSMTNGNIITTTATTTTSTAATMQRSRLSFDFDHNAQPPATTTAITAVVSGSASRQQDDQWSNIPLLQLQADLDTPAPPDSQRSAAFDHLLESVQEVNQLITTFAKSVQVQGETLDLVEDNIDHSDTQITQGNSYLAKGSRYKAALYPVVGAAIGTLLGGPVGFVAGLKLGGAAALSGSALGYAGGRLIKKRQEKTTALEMTKLDYRNAALRHHGNDAVTSDQPTE